MRKLHVLMKKEELDGQRLDGKVVIVLDILFATTTIVAALSEGASELPYDISERLRAYAEERGLLRDLLPARRTKGLAKAAKKAGRATAERMAQSMGASA